MEGLLPVFCLCTWAREALCDPGAKLFEMVEMGCSRVGSLCSSFLQAFPPLPSVLHILLFSWGASLAAVSGGGCAGGLCPWFIFLAAGISTGGLCSQIVHQRESEFCDGGRRAFHRPVVL